jgi:hypothetical protein
MAPWYCSRPQQISEAIPRSVHSSISFAIETHLTLRFRQQPFRLCNSPFEVRRLDCAQLQIQERGEIRRNSGVYLAGVHLSNQLRDRMSYRSHGFLFGQRSGVFSD